MLPEEETAGKFHTFQLRSHKVPHYISEALGVIDKCRNWSEYAISGLIHTASNVEMKNMTVIRFESVYNRAEVGKDVPMEADSQIGIRPKTNMYLEHPPSTSFLVRIAWHSWDAMTNRSKRSKN